MIEISANGDSVIRVSCSKLKDDDPWVTEEYRFESVADSGVLVSNSIADSSKLSAVEVQILEFLALEVFDPGGAKGIQIVNALNISERKIYHTLSHLKRELHISHDSKGDPYRLTASGKKLICKQNSKLAQVINLVDPADTWRTA